MKRPIKRIMLISPSVTRPKDFSAKAVRVSVFFPLGIAYLASVLERTGRYELEICDALIEKYDNEGVYFDGGEKIRYGLEDGEIAKRIAEFAPDVVGVSCLFSALQWDTNNICRIAKEINPDIVTVVGGAHAGAAAGDILKQYNTIDFVVAGEGEETLLNLLEAIEKGGDLEKIGGLAFRSKEKVISREKAGYIQNLDLLPFPARHLFPMDSYFADASAHGIFRKTPYTQMITSRGCPLRCTFCSSQDHWGPRQRMRSAKNVLDEIEFLIERYGIKELHFEDENLTANKQRANEIFDGMIKRGFGLNWHVPTGMAVYTLDEELLVKMKASGCYSVSLGIESGNQYVLSKLMNKPVDLKIVPGIVKKIREIGMEARGFFIIGYPGETKETIKQTVEFAKQLELDWAYFSVASPIPNTKLFKICIENGYISKDNFDPIKSFHISMIHTPEFTPEYISRVREEAMRDVNFRNNPNLLKYDIDKAIDDFKGVVAHYPHFDFANFYLGEAYLKKGCNNEAIRYYNRALHINPSYYEAKNRLEKLGIKSENEKTD